MDSATTAALLIELAKIALNSYFSLSKLSGMTEEEINATFLEEREKFRANDPAKLPDV